MLVQRVLGQFPGYAWLAAIDPVTGRCKVKAVTSVDLDDELVRWSKIKANLYFCVNSTDCDTARREQFVSTSKVVYADLDDKVHWKELKLEPSIVTETSPGKFQAFWCMERFQHPSITSDLSHRIATYHNLDACWDRVRLMRLPGSINFKRVWVGDHRVKIVHDRPLLYRPEDFPYEAVERGLKYIEYETEENSSPYTYQELQAIERNRIDNYTLSAVNAELMKLAELATLKPGQRMLFHGYKGLQEFGWERGTMWVARGLTEIANAPWNTYTLENAFHDFMTHAPTDLNWTKNDNYAKWQSAINKNCKGTVRFRKFPSGEQ